jgi:hypothetical protein
MSSKATVIDNADGHIYEETNRPQSVFGKIIGWDIMFDVLATSVKSIKFEGEYFTAIFKENSPIALILGNMIKIWGGDLISVEMDDEYLSIEIKGGTNTAKQLKSIKQ